jgi:hypothetical protein
MGLASLAISLRRDDTGFDATVCGSWVSMTFEFELLLDSPAQVILGDFWTELGERLSRVLGLLGEWVIELGLLPIEVSRILVGRAGVSVIRSLIVPSDCCS